MIYQRVPYISFNQRRTILWDQFRKAWLIILFGLLLLVAGLFILLNNEVFYWNLQTQNLF